VLWGKEIVRARRAHNVVQIDTVATDPDLADQDPVSIKRKAAREYGDTVRQLATGASEFTVR
jgi:hypothetical protein